jgi:hypothetical protein
MQMKTTPNQMQQDEQAYADAYDEEAAMPAEQSEDEAFGLVPEAASEEDDYPNSPEEAMLAEDEAAEPMAEPVAEPVAEAPDSAKETQRLKSWEGRLKALEAQLKSSKSAPDDSGGDVMGDGDGDEGIEDGGNPDLATAMKALSDDFGEGFTKMLIAIIDAKVGQANENVAKSVDEIINDIVDTKAKAHFEAIADKHPDFMDVADSPAFAEFIAAQEDAAKAQQVVDGGTSREINALLDAFKATQAQPEQQGEPAEQVEQADDGSMDAAEGVRSTGMRLPMQPKASSDYADAWREFAD